MPKQKAGGLLILAAVVLTTLACSRSPSSSSGDTDRVKVELRVLNYYNTATANSTGEITNIWEAFGKANPDVMVFREDLNNQPFHIRVEAYAAAGQLPDVLYAWPTGRSTTLHTQGLLKDLGPLVERDGLAALFSPAALDPNAQNAGYLAILPRSFTSTHAFFINNEVLKAAGLTPARTYAELKAQVSILRDKGYQTVIMSNKDDWVMQSCLFSLLAGRFCGPEWDTKILSGEARFTDTDFVNALYFVQALYDDGVISRDALETDVETGRALFAANKGAYYINGDWAIGAFVTDKSTGQALISPARQLNFQISLFPDIEGAKLNGSTSVVLGTGWGMNANIPAGSAREDAAWRLIKWLSGKETQTWLLQTGAITIATRTDIDAASLVLEPLQIAGSNLTGRSTGTAVIDGVFADEVYTVVNEGLEAIGLGTADPLQVAGAIQRAFDTWQAKQ
jgi:raffinose/stachyose/melibiose transport system substrate-binding protein